jgi:hypothetical protein
LYISSYYLLYLVSLFFINTAIQNKTEYKGYFWRYKKTTNKNHRKSEWTDIKIKEVALLCSYKAEFKTKYQQAYSKAKELGIFTEVTKHMKRPKAKNQYTNKINYDNIYN